MTKPSQGDLAKWLDHLDRAGLDPKTIASYRRGVSHFIRWNWQTYNTEFDPSAIIQRDVVDWKAYQQTVERARPATINLRLAAMSSFFKWAVAQEQARINPVEGVKSLGMAKVQPKALDKRTERVFLRTVHQSGNVRDIAIVELLLGSGLRVSELLDLKVGDVEISDKSGKVVVRSGKQAGYREVPLTSNVRKALSDYLESLPKIRENDAGFWKSQRGELKNRSSINKLIEKYALLARIEPFGPHVCRHTFSVRYLEKNPGDLRGLAALLGHRSLNTVMIYTEPTLDELATRMEAHT
jgi:site-specific recombinase XerC